MQLADVPEFNTWEEMVSFYQRTSSRASQLELDSGVSYSSLGRRASAIHFPATSSKSTLSSPAVSRFGTLGSSLGTVSEGDGAVSGDDEIPEIGSRQSFYLEESSASLAAAIDDDNTDDERKTEELATPAGGRARSRSTASDRGASSRDPDDEWVPYTARTADGATETLFYNKALSQVAPVQIPEQTDVKRVEVQRALMKAVQDVLLYESVGDPKLHLALSGGARDEDPVENGKINSLKYLTGALMKIETIVNSVLKQCPALPQQLTSNLSKMIELAEDMSGDVEELTREADEDEIKALLGWNQSHWNFDNEHVRRYRAAATARWRAKLQDPWARETEADGKSTLDRMYERFQADVAYPFWHMPKHESLGPIPQGRKNTKGGRPIVLKVMLPNHDNTEVKGKKESTVKLRPDATARSIIKAVLKKKRHEGHDEDIEKYALKAVGYNEFMYDSDILLNSESVVNALRAGTHPRLQLVQKLPSIERKEEELKKTKDFFTKYFSPHLGAAGQQDHGGRQLHAAQMRAPVAWPFTSNMVNSEVIRLENMELPFWVKIRGVENCTRKALPKLSQTPGNLVVKAFIVYGCKRILFDKTTQAVAPSSCARWDRELDATENYLRRLCMYKNIPRLARIAFVLCELEQSKRKSDEMIEIPIAYAVTQLMDEEGFFLQGQQNFKMWPCVRKSKKAEADPTDLSWIYRATNRENLSGRNVCSMFVEFRSFNLPVFAPLNPAHKSGGGDRLLGEEMDPRDLSKEQRQKIEELLYMDVLDEIKKEHEGLLWQYRHSLTKYPQLLPKFLRNVDWEDAEYMHEAHTFLYKWAPPYSASDALLLLDVNFPDPRVRSYAMECLQRMSDDELKLYLLQLTQCLKYEAYHASRLSRFLIERSLQSPLGIGHHFFWHLKAEMAFAPEFKERYAVILEEYLSLCGPHLKELTKQSVAVHRLEAVSARIVHMKREEKNGSTDCKRELDRMLTELNDELFGPAGKMQVPLNPKLEVTTLRVEKCGYLSSKMVPLWLVFKNADPKGKDVYVIFKSGDDLRQDILTLQILQVMDRLWLEAGHDLRLNPYQVIATGVNAANDGVGMIQVVMNSKTTSKIQVQYGGGATGAFNPKCLWTYLHEHNRKNFDRAIENFTRSCAGYCVATFVMGIGDRHNDNIMCTKDGHLFHIDFGHFLGNFKTKFGFNRERTAFVFTPEMAYVMTQEKNTKSKNYATFLSLAKAAYNVCREKATVLEMLFLLMVPAGMPELMKASDISYLKKKMYLHLDHTAASKKLDDEIRECKSNTYRLIDNWIHNMKHAK